MSENIQVGSIRMEFLRSKHVTAGSLDLMRIPPAGQMPVAHYHRNWDETVYGLEGTIPSQWTAPTTRLSQGTPFLSSAASCTVSTTVAAPMRLALQP